MNRRIILVVMVYLCSPIFLSCGTSRNEKTAGSFIEWNLAELYRSKSEDLEIIGNPEITSSPFGEALFFDGVDDALLLDRMPISILKEFTVEMVFKPALNAPFEQRILHIGTISDDRMLLEIRAVGANWYFDGFAASGVNKLALIDENLLHPLDDWYHVAFVITADKLATYVNGKLELQQSYTFEPINNGSTSIGVRLNKDSWFKGAIYKIKITPKELNPNSFIYKSKFFNK